MALMRHGHGMASVNQIWSYCANQMGKTQSKPLAARHGMGTACYVWIGLYCPTGNWPNANSFSSYRKSVAESGTDFLFYLSSSKGATLGFTPVRQELHNTKFKESDTQIHPCNLSTLCIGTCEHGCLHGASHVKGGPGYLGKFLSSTWDFPLGQRGKTTYLSKLRKCGALPLGLTDTLSWRCACV